MNKAAMFPSIFADVPRKAQSLLIALSLAVMEVEIEQERIREGLGRLTLPDRYPRLSEKSAVQGLIDDELIHETVMADVHFWLVAWGNINKLLLSLRKTMHDPQLDRIQGKRNRWFLTIKSARNSLEHIDERSWSSKSRLSPIEDVYLESRRHQQLIVFGVRVKLDNSAFNKITNLKKDLNRWHTNLPTILDKRNMIG